MSEIIDILFIEVCVRFKLSFETYAKNVREKITKCCLITNEVLLDADGHVLKV